MEKLFHKLSFFLEIVKRSEEASPYVSDSSPGCNFFSAGMEKENACCKPQGKDKCAFARHHPVDLAPSVASKTKAMMQTSFPRLAQLWIVPL